MKPGARGGLFPCTWRALSWGVIRAARKDLTAAFGERPPPSAPFRPGGISSSSAVCSTEDRPDLPSSVQLRVFPQKPKGTRVSISESFLAIDTALRNVTGNGFASSGMFWEICNDRGFRAWQAEGACFVLAASTRNETKAGQLFIVSFRPLLEPAAG